MPLISAIHIKNGEINFDRRRRYVDTELYTRWMSTPLRTGDVLLTSKAPLGEVAVVPDNGPLVLSQRLFGLRPQEQQLDKGDLFYWLTSPGAVDQLTHESSGTTVSGIRQAELLQLEIPLPSLAEQKLIVRVVEDHLSRLDVAHKCLIAANRRVDLLKKSALLHLIPMDAPNTWRWATVADAGRVDLGRQRHPDWHTGPEMHPYLRVSNVFEDRIDASIVMQMDFSGCFERFKLHLGDIILNEGQSPEFLGRPAIYRGVPENVAFTNSLIRFRANQDVLPEWALLVFRRHMHAGRFA